MPDTKEEPRNPDTLSFLDWEKWRNTGKWPEEPEKPAEAQKTEAAAAPVEKTESGNETTSAGSEEPEPAALPEEGTEEQETRKAEEEKSGKPSRGIQKRFDELTRKNRELERRLADAEGKLSEKPEEQEAESLQGKAKPQLEEFTTEVEYLEALTDWKVDQRLEAEREAYAERQAETEKAEAGLKWQKQIAETKKELKDFDEVVDTDTPISPAMRDAILESEHGARLLYHLAKNPEEAERIANLTPPSRDPERNARTAARELAKIEVSLTAKKESPAPAQKPKITPAPEPIPRIAGKSTGAVSKDLNDPALANDFAAWEKERTRQLAGR